MARLAALRRVWGSCRLAFRQPKARQVKLAVLGVTQGHNAGHYVTDGTQPRNDCASLVEPPHMGIARGEIAVGEGKPGRS
jgi:hypothetical protein